MPASRTGHARSPAAQVRSAGRGAARPGTASARRRFTGWINRAYRQTRKRVTRIPPIAITFPINALQILPSFLLRRDPEFKAIYGLNFSEYSLPQRSAILLALLGFGAYSLVLANPVIGLAKTVAIGSISRSKTSTMTTLRPAKLRRTSLLIRNGALIFQTRLCINLVSQGDDLVLGLFANTTEFGYYVFA
jgi:O-antigen/teichoic acid export membrane protein